MRELKYIIKICESAFDLKIKEKKRQKPYILARSAYYYYARKYTNYSLDVISSLVNKDHSTVLHGASRFENYTNQFWEYKAQFKEINAELRIVYCNLEKSDIENKSFDEIQIQSLAKRLALEQNKNRVLKHSIKRISEGIPVPIKYILENYTEKALSEFVETKVNPSIIMNKSQNNRLVNYNPRQNNTY